MTVEFMKEEVKKYFVKLEKDFFDWQISMLGSEEELVKKIELDKRYSERVLKHEISDEQAVEAFIFEFMI